MGKRKKKGKPVRSNESQKRINAVKRINLGCIPLFVQLAHKGLEKSIPEGTKGHGGEVAYVVSKDILAVSIHRPELLESIDKIEIIYAPKAQ